MGSSSAVGLLAKRFLLSKASDGFISLIAWVSVIGVMLGVLALTVVTSVINGFEGELVQNITGMNGDIILYSRTDAISDPAAVESKIRKIAPDVVAITDSFVSELMISGPNSVAGAVLEGFDPVTLGAVTVIPKRVVAGRLPADEGEVALTSVLAERLGAEVNSEIRLVIPAVGEGGETASPKAVKSKVVGIVKMGMYEYDSKFAFVTLAEAQKIMEQPGKVTSFKMKLARGSDSRQVSDNLGNGFSYPFRAKDWGQLNKNLFYAIKLEKVVIAIILTVIVIVAAFNVVSTLMMMIHDKTREIAILKAMGFRKGQSFGLFCMIGLGMGTVGTVLGVLLGLGVVSLLHKTRWIALPSDIYYISFLPVVVRWGEVGLIALAALLISFFATLYPGWKVAKRSPLDGLRYE